MCALVSWAACERDQPSEVRGPEPQRLRAVETQVAIVQSLHNHCKAVESHLSSQVRGPGPPPSVQAGPSSLLAPKHVVVSPNTVCFFRARVSGMGPRADLHPRTRCSALPGRPPKPPPADVNSREEKPPNISILQDLERFEGVDLSSSPLR